MESFSFALHSVLFPRFGVFFSPTDTTKVIKCVLFGWRSLFSMGTTLDNILWTI